VGAPRPTSHQRRAPLALANAFLGDRRLAGTAAYDLPVGTPRSKVCRHRFGRRRPLADPNLARP
jgi:hypothetical protein